MTSIGNLRPRLLTRDAWVLVPALVATVAVAGVTVPSALDAQAREARVAMARERIELLRAECERVEALRAELGLESTANVPERAPDRLPADLSPIAALSAVRIAAGEGDVVLEALTTGAVELVGSSAAGRVNMRTLFLTGEARLADLVELPRRLRERGHPGAALELRLAREDVRTERFRFELDLGLFFFDPEEVEHLPAEGGAAPPGAEGHQPGGGR